MFTVFGMVFEMAENGYLNKKVKLRSLDICFQNLRLCETSLQCDVQNQPWP